MGYICSRCNEVVHGNVNRLVWHIRNRHALMSGHRFTCPIMCGQDGCLQTFRFSVAFKHHIENKHKNTDLNNGHNENDDDGDDDQDDNPPNNGPLDDIPPPSVNNILNKDEVTELAASTIAKLKSSIIEMFHNFQHPFQQLETAYQQQKYFSQTGHFIKPREVPFAIAYHPHNNPDTGHVDQMARHITFQYIPLKQLLKHILESKGFMRAVLEYQPSDDGIMRDFHDGEFCRGHVFFSNSRNIALLLYVDDCEIANPLGSKAGMHKIGVVYCTILNIPLKFRSSLCNCYLVGLYNSGDVKTYGFDPILRPLVEDIEELERDGLHIDTDVFQGRVQIGIAQVTGDNLGLNRLRSQ